MLKSKTNRRNLDIWPGFVDAISTLLLVLIFLLSVFMLSEVFLTYAISGKDDALEKLNLKILELNDLLDIEKKESTKLSDMVAQLSTDVSHLGALNDQLHNEILVLNKEREMLSSELEEVNSEKFIMQKNLESLSQEKVSLEDRVFVLTEQIKKTNEKLSKNEIKIDQEREISEKAQRQIAILNAQLYDLRDRMAMIQKALDASEKDSLEKGIRITELGKKLNAALAKKVGELARYRSEFFGKLREILGNRDDITIVGDRFILQSEILFESGSAQIGSNGSKQLAEISRILLEISSKIPKEIQWVIQIQGHTDNIPISNSVYPSNWELSIARAMSVAEIMINNLVPPDKISVACYGENRPLSNNSD